MFEQIMGFHVVCFVLVALFGCLAEAASYTANDAFSTPLNCTSDSECTNIDKFGLCVIVDITASGVTTSEPRCVCDSDNAYYKKVGVDDCVYHANLGESCVVGDTTCLGTNIQCREDGDNAGTYRCLCQYGFVKVPDSSGFKCAKIIHKAIDAACSACDSNDGTCYDLDNNNLKDGCVCPSFTSGPECGTLHVHVACDVNTFTMRVCYTPHSAYDFTKGAVMLVDGTGRDVACKGTVVTTDPDCTTGQVKLVLPLEDGSRQRCGTQMFMADPITRKYETKIVVQKTIAKLGVDDVAFRTSCSFQTHAETSFKPVGLIVINADDLGQHHEPQLSFLVENHLGNSVPAGVALRLGDEIRFKIILAADGTYAAIRVLRCTASTSPMLSDSNAFTLPLILQSCPFSQQTHFSDQNNWHLISNLKNELQTGLVRMFKMPQGRSVHLHCLVKLCLVRSESDCNPVSCTSPAPHLSYGRRKRAVTDNPNNLDLSVSRELLWYDESTKAIGFDSPTVPDGMTVTGDFPWRLYSGLVAVLTLLLIAFVIIAGVLFVKLRSLSSR